MKSVFACDSTPFAQRLAEAIAWAQPRASVADAKRSLRSYELQPWVLAGDRTSTVIEVLRRREMHLSASDAASEGQGLAGGRLLVYFPDGNLADGAAEVQSEGFFDVDNTPPWDTWVALGTEPTARDVNHRVYLITWVPAPLLDLAAHGIAVNPEVCICWLEDAPIAARHELRAFLR